MKIFIRAAAAISPQPSFQPGFLDRGPVELTGNRYHCQEPDYEKIIDPKMIRRMSRIIRMGTAAALQCLKNAQTEDPDAITTGTAYGCLEDTGIFLTKMIENKEELLTPTAFIQSTHNTVGAQIALMIKCHRYNNTYVHRGFSFESALLDATLLENETKRVLVGGVDEITDTSHSILSRFGLFKQGKVSNLHLYDYASPGTVNGEGACFFLLSTECEEHGICLEGMTHFYAPESPEEARIRIEAFLSLEDRSGQIDLVIDGRNGDADGDRLYETLRMGPLGKIPAIPYKWLCGDYPTSTAFALWLADGILRRGSLPAWMHAGQPFPVDRILIYNHYQQIYHSAFLIRRC